MYYFVINKIANLSEQKDNYNYFINLLNSKIDKDTWFMNVVWHTEASTQSQETWLEPLYIQWLITFDSRHHLKFSASLCQYSFTHTLPDKQNDDEWYMWRYYGLLPDGKSWITITLEH